jgi:hypothetical protein
MRSQSELGKGVEIGVLHLSDLEATDMAMASDALSSLFGNLIHRCAQVRAAVLMHCCHDSPYLARFAAEFGSKLFR